MRPSTRRTSRRARAMTRGSCVENRKVTCCSRFRFSIISSKTPRPLRIGDSLHGHHDLGVLVGAEDRRSRLLGLKDEADAVAAQVAELLAG